MFNNDVAESTTNTYLIQQAVMHPAICPKDLIKLCHQTTFGAEHLLEDLTTAERSFSEEFTSATANTSALYEQISPDYCRVNLFAWKQRRLPPEWLFRMFSGSAAMSSGTAERFRCLLKEVDMLCASDCMPFSYKDWKNGQNAYWLSGGGMVHHSNQYKRKEHPSYRLICSHFIRLFPLLEKLATLKTQNHAHVIALDGHAASGKTTIAKQLSLILGAGIVHMDDFFLPTVLRTEQRLAEPGGNIHYERFAQEVLPKITQFEAFSYRRFDCAKLDFGSSQEVCASKWRVVEGAYSCHPLFGNYADIKGFCNVEPEEQLRRIQFRNGAEGAKVFKEKWIPMEECYFKRFHIRKDADMIL